MSLPRLAYHAYGWTDWLAPGDRRSNNREASPIEFRQSIVWRNRMRLWHGAGADPDTTQPHGTAAKYLRHETPNPRARLLFGRTSASPALVRAPRAHRAKVAQKPTRPGGNNA